MSMIDSETGPDDPTQAGPALPRGPEPGGAGAALLAPSGWEVQALCLKAARGAGYSWGLAEEAGHAALWLALRGLPGPAALLHLLTGPAGATPHPAPGAWQRADGAPLCPLATGAALSDHACLPEGRLGAGGIALGPVRAPLLLLPFVAQMAAMQDRAVRLTCDESALAIPPAGAVSGTVGAAWRAPLAAMVTLTPADDVSHDDGVSDDDAHPPAPRPAPMDRALWAALDAYALRITVPASETSRAGAGAAGDDND